MVRGTPNALNELSCDTSGAGAWAAKRERGPAPKASEETRGTLWSLASVRRLWPAGREALRPEVFPPQVTLRTHSLPFHPPLCRPPAAGRHAVAAGLWPRVLAPEGGAVPFESELPLTPRARACQPAKDAACALDQLIRSAYTDEIHLSFPLRLAPKSVPNLSV